MKKSFLKPFSGLFIASLLLSFLTLTSGCVVRPGGYHRHHHHHHHRGW